MPHDARGRLIELGDYVKVKPINKPEKFVVGRVAQIREGQFCSGDVRWCGGDDEWHRGLGAVIGKIEDDAFDAASALIIVKADGSEPEAGRDPVEAEAEEPASA